MSTTESKSPPLDGADVSVASPNGLDESFFVGRQSKAKRKLPQWLDHFNAKDLKVLFKCSVAVWIMTIFVFIDATLNVLGQAAFFGCIVLFIVPPSGVVFIHVLAGLTICFGLALGWAWGVITMKAALATRPQADLNARLLELAKSMPQNTTNVGQASGQTTYAQIAIYEGFMLDTRVTVTYFCMIGLFVYLLARLRVTAPKLMLVGLFATIIGDVYLTSAPLIPTFQGTIPKIMIIPVAIAVGIGAVCNLLIFPQSTSQIVVGNMKDIVTPMAGFITALNHHFQNPDTRFDLPRLLRLKTELALAYKSLDMSIKFLPMDVTYSKWSPEDISALQEPLRQVFVAFGGLLNLSITREQVINKGEALMDAAEALYDDKSPGAKFPIAYHQITRAVDLRAYVRHPATDEMITKTLGMLSASIAPLFEAWAASFRAIGQGLNGPPEQKAAQDILAQMKNAQADFETSSAQNLLEGHSYLFDADGNVLPPETPDHPPPLHGLMLGLLFRERIANLSKAATDLLEKATEISQKRSKPRVWLPKGIQRLFAWSLSKDEPPTTVQGTLDLKQTMTAVSQHEKKRKGFGRKPKESAAPVDHSSAAARLEAMRQPTGRQRHRASMVLLALIDWFTNDAGLHALRTLILTLALAVPAAVPASAGFYYREKGMWALIMAQMSLVPYASDFVSGLLIRTAGTVAGGILGMVCWYIGAGNGPGNPYGLAAVMAVAIVVMMWWRLFAPPEQMAAGIMLTSTMYMVVSYSWIDTHIPSYGNPGVGYTLFWRRVLLVMIGFAASTFVMFFPRPPSGSRHYRHVLSDQLSAIKDRYALFVSAWRSPPADLVEVVEKEGIVSDEVLTALVGPIRLTKFEFSTSNIDSATLSQVCDLCLSMNIHMTQLVLYVEKLPAELRSRFVYHTGAGDEGLVADLMAVISLIQQSLVSGEPIPAVLPVPLVGRALGLSRGTKRAERGPEETSAREQLGGETGGQWASVVNAFIRLLSDVDDLVMVVKKAVGETSHVDLAAFDSERA
ncbi:hypothetical protein GQ53DRAFT_743052 [Thozetella sp. PMI_491]|nr:hypothetical protein GQ53DRAFT_743052 [Thozetella sp. PMI_491]